MGGRGWGRLGVPFPRAPEPGILGRMTIEINGESLTAAQVVQVARASSPDALLAAAARERLGRTRAYIESRWMHDEAPLMYPGKGNAEDHVSNSTWCARKARTIVANTEQIVAVELLMAAQALALTAPLAAAHPLGRGTAAAFEVIGAAIPPALDGDRWFDTEMATALDLVRSGGISEAVEAAVGPLE